MKMRTLHKDKVDELHGKVLQELLQPSRDSVQMLPGQLCNLAASYNRGYVGCLERNPIQAFLLYLKAAESGHALAMARAAKMLMQGVDIVKDPVHSLYLLMHVKDRYVGKDRALIDFRIVLLLQLPQIVQKLYDRKRKIR
jgi:hypothetical protein